MSDKEYIITDNQLDILERVSVSGYSNVFRNIRSRPFSASAIEDITPEGASIIQAAKDDERENLLTELLDISLGVWNLPDLQDKMRVMRDVTRTREKP